MFFDGDIKLIGAAEEKHRCGGSTGCSGLDRNG
jgi:hypothetical protein